MADDAPGLTTREVGRMLGVTAGRVRELLAAGALTGRQTTTGWRVDEGSVRPYLDARRALVADASDDDDERLTEVLARLDRIERLVREQADRDAAPDDPPAS